MLSAERVESPSAVRPVLSFGFVKTILICLPMAVLTFVIFTGGKMPHAPKEMIAFMLTFLFVNAIFFLMIRTGKTDKFRSVFFTSFALALIISFISHMLETRGSMSISLSKAIQCQVPFCHIVIPMTLVPLVLTKTIIFPGTLLRGFAPIATMFVIWVGASLVMGRGFCSWGCFYGGLDDGFSRVMRKPIIRPVNSKWVYLSFAVLLVVVLTAAAALSPTYCSWLCPYKAVTEFSAVTSVKALIQMIIFLSLFIGLVIVLPILTKKRTQCGFFCPFGAMQSFTNKLNPYTVRISKKECVKCRKCLNTCPVLAINETSLEKGRPKFNCLKCGKCIDACPKGALHFHIAGTATTQEKWRLHRILFLYTVFLFLAIFSNDTIRDAIVRILNLITTGGLS